MSQNTLKTKAILAIKISLTAGLLYYVSSLVDLNELKPLFARLDPSFIVVAVITHLGAFFIMSIRWWLILISSGKQIQYQKVFSAYYLGLFCNNFLPTAMGGDVVRIVKLKSEGFDLNQLIFSTLCDRIIGLLSIIIMGIIGLNFSVSIYESIGHNSLVLINIISGMLFLLSLAALHSRLRNSIVNFILIRIRLWSKLNNFLVYVHQNIEALKQSKILSKTILLSLISQLLIIVTYYCIARSLHIELALFEFVLVVPVVAIFTSLPISVGGMGVREGIMVFLLGAVGVLTTNAVSVSLMYLTILIFITLPGGIFLLSGKRDITKRCVSYE
jgi:uncharacterized protein (TIRG00374 family)